MIPGYTLSVEHLSYSTAKNRQQRLRLLKPQSSPFDAVRNAQHSRDVALRQLVVKRPHVDSPRVVLTLHTTKGVMQKEQAVKEKNKTKKTGWVGHMVL